MAYGRVNVAGKYNVGSVIDIYNVTGTAKYVITKVLYTSPLNTHNLSLYEYNLKTGYTSYRKDVSYSTYALLVFDNLGTLLGSYSYNNITLLDDKSYLLYTLNVQDTRTIARYDYKGALLWTYTAGFSGYKLIQVVIQDNYIYVKAINSSNSIVRDIKLDMNGTEISTNALPDDRKDFLIDGYYYDINTVWSSVSRTISITIDKYDASMAKIATKTYVTDDYGAAYVGVSLVKNGSNLYMIIKYGLDRGWGLMGIDYNTLNQLFFVRVYPGNYIGVVSTPKYKNVFGFYNSNTDTLTLYGLNGNVILQEGNILQNLLTGNFSLLFFPDLSFTQVREEFADISSSDTVYKLYKFERYLTIKG